MKLARRDVRDDKVLVKRGGAFSRKSTQTNTLTLLRRPLQILWLWFAYMIPRFVIAFLNWSGTFILIYHQSEDSTAVEDSLDMLAQKHASTRFIKLHHEIAEMETVGAPAIIAYRNGEVIATLAECSAVGLETTLRR